MREECLVVISSITALTVHVLFVIVKSRRKPREERAGRGQVMFWRLVKRDLLMICMFG